MDIFFRRSYTFCVFSTFIFMGSVLKIVDSINSIHECGQWRVYLRASKCWTSKWGSYQIHKTWAELCFIFTYIWKNDENLVDKEIFRLYLSIECGQAHVNGGPWSQPNFFIIISLYQFSSALAMHIFPMLVKYRKCLKNAKKLKNYKKKYRLKEQLNTDFFRFFTKTQFTHRNSCFW